MLKRIVIAAGLAAAPLLMPATAQAQNAQQTRSTNAPVNGVLTIYGNDRCPADTVCVTAPESDRYRIPSDLRSATVRPQATESWALRAGDALDAGRQGTGSCTTVGANGSTGCFVRQATAAKAESRQRREEQTDLPLP